MNKNKGRLLIGLGLAFIIAALGLSGYNLWDNMRAQSTVTDVIDEIRHVYEGVEEPVDDSTEVPDYILNPKMAMRTEKIKGYEYIGVLTIESCGLELPIISEWTYPALKVSPCRFSGSVYTDDMIVAGHNYNSHFKRARSLQVGDEVIFTDMDKNTFLYQVVEKETISGTDIEALEGGDWDLSLFTCTASGQARMVIRCERIK